MSAPIEGCVFCDIVARRLPADIVYEDERTLAFIDLRQANAGHTLVIPKAHFNDVRELNAADGAALMQTVIRVTRAVGCAFANEGLSLWHSIGEAGNQEVPHLHIHVHPRRLGDGLLLVYPEGIENADASQRAQYARHLRAEIARVVL